MPKRLLQRFENYQKSVSHLESEVAQYANTDLDVIKKGIIQSFEVTHELAWKLMQDFLAYQGETELYGSKSATRLAFNRGLIISGDVWLEMVNSRNLTVHTYDEQMITSEFEKIVKLYLPLFVAFKLKMEKICSDLD
ncbi:nucleotidyltransferase [Pasteurellaceae bacterium LFhippo2]|nr:nucleotidyltransferase [Pasteurellaceae bacterium LFhippo2]